MASSRSCFAAFLLIIAFIAAGCAVNAQSDVSTAMFVFGDSYADTGNSDYKSSGAWQPPYGQTWPGVPTGRFSDGMLLTDYIASNLSIETPLPHRNWSSLNMSCDGFSSGVNFAHAGTGIFTTYFEPEGPTLSCQIDEFQRMSDQCSNITSLINSSLVLLVVIGNDYLTFLVQHQHDDNWFQVAWELFLDFIPSVVHGITNSITRLYDIGFRKFAIPNLEPAGCIPQLAAATSGQCNKLFNDTSASHNLLLSVDIALIRFNLPDIQIIILDHYDSFSTAQQMQFDNNLQACITADSICSNPNKFFFWDDIHPTQAGWKAVTEIYMEEVCKLAGSCNEQQVGFE